MLDKIQLENALKGIVLLLLSIFGNFIAETFGCQAQKFLSENMFAKHITVVFITFFAISFSQKEAVHPISLVYTTLLVYVLFVLFTRMSFTFTVIVFCLVVAYYFNNTMIQYYSRLEKTSSATEESSMIKKLKLYQNIFLIVIITTIVIGFLLYFQKQLKMHRNDWSTVKFLFGVNTCDSK